MSEYDDTFRAGLLDVRDEVLADLVADGILMREVAVRVALEMGVTGANAARGKPGTKQTQLLALSPRPEVVIRDQFRYRGGAPTHIGDAKVTISRAAVTEAQLCAAAYFLIGGDMALVEDGSGFLTEDGGQLILEGGEDVPKRYNIVQGELRQEALDWIVVLTRVSV